MPIRRLIVAAVACLLLAGCSAGAPSQGRRTGTGTNASARDFRTGWHPVTGRSITLASSTPSEVKDWGPDHLLLINFWASWCGPCKAELPLLQRLDQNGRVRVFGVSRDVEASSALKALAEDGAHYPDLVDTSGSYSTDFAGLIPLNAIPSSILMRDGHVLAVHVGPFSGWRDLMQGIAHYDGGTSSS